MFLLLQCDCEEWPSPEYCYWRGDSRCYCYCWCTVGVCPEEAPLPCQLAPRNNPAVESLNSSVTRDSVWHWTDIVTERMTAETSRMSQDIVHVSILPSFIPHHQLGILKITFLYRYSIIWGTRMEINSVRCYISGLL